jgi:hypothetical protein
MKISSFNYASTWLMLIRVSVVCICFCACACACVCICVFVCVCVCVCVECVPFWFQSRSFVACSFMADFNYCACSCRMRHNFEETHQDQYMRSQSQPQICFYHGFTHTKRCSMLFFCTKHLTFASAYIICFCLYHIKHKLCMIVHSQMHMATHVCVCMYMCRYAHT